MNDGNIPTDDLVFFHGTGAEAAWKIVTSGARDGLFEEVGAFALGRAIRQAMLNHTGLPSEEDWRLDSMLPPADDEAEHLWFFAMQHLGEPSKSSLFGYGHFAVTLNPAIAYRYTIRNPYRSEFVRALAGGLKILTRVGHPFSAQVPNLFPDAYRAIAFPSPPVVLELHRITRDRLLKEDGSPDIDPHLKLFLSRRQDVTANFRIRDVAPADIAAVHDLHSWRPEELEDPSWRPDPSRVDSGRLAAADWLAQQRQKLNAR